MADNLLSSLEQDLVGIKRLLWGTDIRKDVFKRWSQGFYFSPSEKSALEQCEGGPCVTIAPVQAFMLKNLLLEYRDLSFREMVNNSEAQSKFLIQALLEILQQCSAGRYCIVYLNCDPSQSSSIAELNPNVTNSNDVSPSNSEDSVGVESDVVAFFHDNLKVEVFSTIQDVNRYYVEHTESLTSKYGILLFLYSVIMTRGLEQVKAESDNNDPMIDQTYGYGSQNLINLMITGRGTTYVWDNNQDVGGLRLQGIQRQSQIGFITIMEHMRFCTVGSFYKNPVHPVWVLGSDTHLTVLFSDERKLVSPETKSEQAKRVFKSYDPDGNNFINTDLLGTVLQALDLVSDEEYVNIMKRKLDSENLGIILMNAFMDEFFPKEESSIPDMFTLIHYNGIPQSNVNGQVQYHIGSAILLESELKSTLESNQMLTVLQTKWPNIEVSWRDNRTPSLN